MSTCKHTSNGASANRTALVTSSLVNSNATASGASASHRSSIQATNWRAAAGLLGEHGNSRRASGDTATAQAKPFDGGLMPVVRSPSNV